MESAFLRMWDPKIFCSSVVLWSSVVHAFWCYPGSVVHIFLTLSWLVPGPLDHYQNCCSFYPPHSFNFDFKVFVFWESFSYFHWSVLFSGNGYINEHAACFVFVLDYNVWSLAFISISVCIYWHLPQDCDVVLLLFRAHAQTISHLCLYSSLCRCSSGGMTMAALLVCVCIQYWPAHDHSAPCHNMVNSFLKLTTNPVHWVCAIF